ASAYCFMRKSRKWRGKFDKKTQECIFVGY
ncbi:hypothetical protein WN51_12624, partial [Melipona quadrifasciata]